jgi:hypothetical protein
MLRRELKEVVAVSLGAACIVALVVLAFRVLSLLACLVP